jgi:hypothetical protein
LPSTMGHFLLTSMYSLNVMTNSSSAFLFAAYLAVLIFLFLGSGWRRSCQVKQWSWWTDLAHPPRSWSTAWGVDCFESLFLLLNPPDSSCVWIKMMAGRRENFTWS